MATTLDIEELIKPDTEAFGISNNWREWSVYRDNKIEEWKELRNYLFATDTRTTSNKRLPWANSTTTPKLTQIRDNLHANYFAALFPQRKWFVWKGNDKDAVSSQKRTIIEAYVRAKAGESGFMDTGSRLILDWIDTGNCFAMVEHQSDLIDRGAGDVVAQYVGPALKRISPYDIVFNPIADSFDKTPKIIKEVVTVGDLIKRVHEDPSQSWLLPAIEKMEAVRGNIVSADSEFDKSDGYIADGFSSLINYYTSGYVELLHFFGDIYNQQTKELQTNRIITVADRAHVLRNIVNPSWNGSAMIRHGGWRQRPDNLYAMGPLENLVGLQYRIDHLENLKADVWDQIAYPIKKISGDVQEFSDNPGERIYLGEEGDVTYLVPDATVLNADLQIRDIADKMEELAGAPRSAMGIRTPGEKTAFEVQTLDQGASRIFVHKASHLDRTFFQPLLNDMLEVGRRNMDTSEVVKVIDEELGAAVFETITREDITAKGTLFPMGASHFAERSARIQNLQNLWNLKLSDPSVGAHLSGKGLARLLSEELSEDTLFSENIAVFEQVETQNLVNEAQVQQEDEEAVAIEAGI
jgi:hypothetical protein